MKHSLFIAFFLCLGSFASAQQLTSPDGNLSLEFMEQADGVPAYRLDYKGKPVLTSGICSAPRSSCILSLGTG